MSLQQRPGVGIRHGGPIASRPSLAAALLLGAFARLGIERPIVVGHSWGTLVAPALALDHPDAVTLAPRQERASAEETALMEPTVTGFAPRCRTLRVPVAIMAGAEDRLVDPARHSVRLHQDLPGSTLAVVPGQGHMVHHGAPDVVANAIDAVASRSRQ